MGAEVVKPKRGARARLVREGIRVDMTNDQIVQMVQEEFPEQTRKKVQTMISRYRKYLKYRA